MSFFVKQRLYFYKKFRVDIWGIIKTSLNMKGVYFFYWKFKYQKEFLNKFKIYCDSNFFKNWEVTINFKEFKFLSKYYMIVSEKMLIKYDILRVKEADKYKFLFNLLLENYFKIEITKKISYACNFFFKQYLIKRSEKALRNQPFIYDIITSNTYKKQKYLKESFASLRLIKLYYIHLTYKHLQKLAKRAKSQYGSFEENYLFLLECRLPSIIYRSGLIANMFEAFDLVKWNVVWVNKTFVTNIYYNVKFMEFVGFRILFKGYIFWEFYKRLIRKALILKNPKFMFFSFYFLFFFIIKKPRKKHLIYPFKLDIYRVSSFAC